MLTRLAARHPGDADVLTLLGLLARAEGDAAGALAAFADARAADPGNPARLLNLGLALKQAGQHAEAVAALEAALAARPGHGATLAGLGSCLIAADRADEALPVLREAIAAGPGHAEAWNNLGVALGRTGDGSAARDAFAEAVRLRPGFREARLNLADRLLADNQLSVARAMVAPIIAAEPGHMRAATLEATIAERSGAPERAIAVYRRALAAGGLHAVPAINLARLLIAAGQPGEALDWCARLLKAAPSITTPLAFRMAALDRLGDSTGLAALTRLDTFVRVRDVEAVAGFATLAAFDRALLAELAADAGLTRDPAGLVTQGGSQSGDLADVGSPGIAALAQIARRELGAYLGALGPDDHPWVQARPGRWTLSLWGTILQPGGAVGPHIHAPNWLSGVYYPWSDAPPPAGQGWFAIGCLPAALGGGGTVSTIEPRAGRMILFPSFLWHATLPFGGSAPRPSFAFDLVPDGIGRPHRLPPRR